MLDRMRDLIMPATGQVTPGLLREQDYEAVGRAMRSDGLIRNYPGYATFSGRADAGK
jgi:NitT/TauT family transport system substrate-binding protein